MSENGPVWDTDTDTAVLMDALRKHVRVTVEAQLLYDAMLDETWPLAIRLLHEQLGRALREVTG